MTKHEIISLRGAFHGRLFGTVAATDRPQYRNPFRPLAGGIHIHERDLTELSKVISDAATCAVIIEPIQGEGGVRVLDTGFVRELRALTKERNVLLILDEIQCGYGRTGTLLRVRAVRDRPRPAHGGEADGGRPPDGRGAA